MDYKTMGKKRKRPLTYKKKKSSKRINSTVKNNSYLSGRFKSSHPLMRHMRRQIRSSLDHLTFHQIKLERIKQDREIDTAQKR